MKDYSDFFKEVADKLNLHFENCRGMIDLPDESFKFVCPMGNELEICINKIIVLNYPLMIGDLYINNFIKSIPSFIKGIKYEMYLLYNGSGVATDSIFSEPNEIYSDLYHKFEKLYGSLYLSSNFHKGKEIK